MARRTALLAAASALAFVAGGVGPARAEDDPVAAAEALLDSGAWEQRVKGVEALEALPGNAKAEKVLIRTLADPDWGVEIRATKALAKVGAKDGPAPAKDALIRLAVDGEIQWVRDAAVEALRSSDRVEAATSLLFAARSAKVTSVRARALLAAGMLASAEHAKKMRPFLKDPETLVVAAAVRAYGRLALDGSDAEFREEVIDVLAGFLERRAEKKDFFAYAAALEGLGAVDLPRTRDLLVEEVLLQPDDDAYACERISRSFAKMDAAAVATIVRAAFGRLKDGGQARRLLRLVARLRIKAARGEVEACIAGTIGQSAKDPKAERVRSEAARALGLLGDPAAVPALEALLHDPSGYVRTEVVTALAKLLPPAEFRALAETLRGDATPEIRVQAVVEMNDAGDPEAIPVLASYFTDKSWRVASAAVAAVGTLGIASDLPLLLPLRVHRSWQIRAAGYEAMGRLRAAAAIPHLTEGLLDKDPVVRGVCHANLQILTKRKMEADAKVWRTWWAKYGEDLVLIKRSRRTPEERAKEEGAKERYAHEVYERKRGVEILQKARILVVSGAWDHVERVLDHLAIPHTLLRAQQLNEAGLNPNQLLLVNCEGNLDKDAVERVRWFVNVGGYVMDTDWALTKAVTLCFPGYVKQFSGSTTGNDVVVVEDALPGHPFTAGIFENVPALMWWLEIQAFPIVVEWPERCEVIVDSAAMRQRYGSSPMAATFRFGLGKVQHSVSHFFLQEEGMTKAADPRARMVFAADNLGIPLDAIRRLADDKRFSGALTEETMKEIAPEYSMFRLIVNVVKEKSKWVEDL